MQLNARWAIHRKWNNSLWLVACHTFFWRVWLFQPNTPWGDSSQFGSSCAACHDTERWSIVASTSFATLPGLCAVPLLLAVSSNDALAWGRKRCPVDLFYSWEIGYTGRQVDNTYPHLRRRHQESGVRFQGGSE